MDWIIGDLVEWDWLAIQIQIEQVVFGLEENFQLLLYLGFDSCVVVQ